MAATLSLPSTRAPASMPSAPLLEGMRAQLAAHTAASPAVDSVALLQGQKSVSIVHNGAVYRLQATKLGKLILTK